MSDRQDMEGITIIWDREKKEYVESTSIPDFDAGHIEVLRWKESREVIKISYRWPKGSEVQLDLYPEKVRGLLKWIEDKPESAPRLTLEEKLEMIKKKENQ